MRSSTDVPPRPRRLGRLSRRFWVGIIVVVLLVLFFSLRNLSVLWTDQMWFSSVGLSHVFSTLFFIKAGLALTFGAIFFFIMWGNLLLTDRFGARDLSFDPEDEVVRRYQNIVRPYARRIYAAIALVMGLIAGLNATSQWNNYLLFSHSQSFHQTDPLFHKDLGFYIFTLPFVSFVVTWFLVVLIIALLVTTGFHFLNGGIRTTKVNPRVAPRVKAHLSVIGAAIAVVKAVGYLIAKWELVVSTHGYVQGATYTDIHARVPALTILFWLSLASAGILLYNVRARGWSLPAVAVGLWAFVALVIGVLYPTILQTLKVSPNQESLEAPYIQRNIDFTRSAFGLDQVKYHAFSGSATVTPSEVKADNTTLSNIRLWDPSSNISLETITKRQSLRSYYDFTSISVDRYYINKKLTPVLIGARQLNSTALPSSSWVNEHLQYTHGIGAAVLAANEVDSSTGNPNFVVSNVPPESSNGMPTLTQPDIYFGIGLNGWVVADTKQAELNYQVSSGAKAGTPVENHYQSTGGVQVGGFFRRFALALRLGDFNFLISNQISDKSRVMFVRDVRQMAQKAAPFLSFDSNPYAVIANGEVQYVLDGYTTTSQYPYSENASNLNVNTGGLPGSFNYARNAVKVVVNAYTGAIKFYVADPKDPIIRAYRSAFPSMFLPMSAMPSTIRTHLRYPSNLFSVQAATYGRYHITAAPAFYSASDRWEVSPSTGAGSPSSTIQQTVKTNAAGDVTSISNTPMSPVFTVGSLPNADHQQLLETVDYVPAGNSTTVQNLTGMMIATSDPNDYGQLDVYETERGSSITGPLQADAEINQYSLASQTISLLDQHGSEVLLGNNLTVPLDSAVLYVRPLYVTSKSNPIPQLRYVIAVFNQQVSIEPTLDQALSAVLGTAVSGVTAPSSGSGKGNGNGGTTTSKTAEQYLSQASSDYAAAQSALEKGNLGEYQKDVTAMDTALQAAQTALQKGTSSTTTTTTTTTTLP
ncbi:MAG TPA: UPF0182 family protein [Acidimicrobiales bacterium]